MTTNYLGSTMQAPSEPHTPFLSRPSRRSLLPTTNQTLQHLNYPSQSSMSVISISKLHRYAPQPTHYPRVLLYQYPECQHPRYSKMVSCTSCTSKSGISIYPPTRFLYVFNRSQGTSPFQNSLSPTVFKVGSPICSMAKLAATFPYIDASCTSR